tara:strand:- start:2302 stop:2721 length:420 start_codon:yes stop_codon:yes gene_type:complete
VLRRKIRTVKASKSDGPASTDEVLTAKQKLLVDTLVAKGCSMQEAGLLAGYKGNSARITAYKTLRIPKVASYYQLELRRSLNLSSHLALRQLRSLCSGAKSEYVQLEASKDLLDRAGHKAPEQHQHLLAGDFKIEIDLS